MGLMQKRTYGNRRGHEPMKNYAKLILMATFAILLLTAFASADTSEAHPAYLHALASLRYARAHLEPTVPDSRMEAAQNRATAEIDAAIGEIKEAAIDDGKPLSDHPPVDAQWGRIDRLRRAIEVLDTARKEINKRESDGFAQGLKRRALHRIDGACNAIRHAIELERYQ
jgi:hypothetical protein